MSVSDWKTAAAEAVVELGDEHGDWAKCELQAALIAAFEDDPSCVGLRSDVDVPAALKVAAAADSAAALSILRERFMRRFPAKAGILSGADAPSPVPLLQQAGEHGSILYRGGARSCPARAGSGNPPWRCSGRSRALSVQRP